MVDQSTVDKLLKKHFKGKFEFSVDSNLLVNVIGDISIRGNLPKLPVRFGKVEGSCLWDQTRLTSLEGSPITVTGNFDVSYNNLTSLQGAPQQIGGYFKCLMNHDLTSLEGGPIQVGSYYSVSNCPLTSLDGLAEKIGDYVSFDYDKKLPLLRSLVARQIFIDYIPIHLDDIIQKYAGQGLAGSFACAHEMEVAGYKENAAW